ncbi:MAG: enoyl-CoA hydratase/isomerase family protein, partial [Pseudomonadota bacterium]
RRPPPPEAVQSMSDINFHTTGRAGIITLTRPKALNALSMTMVNDMGEALDGWAEDDGVERVVVTHEGKAFCAGGDIRDVYERREAAVDFFIAEYTNNHRVKRFPKPYISLIDGICMGGGVGISVHGSHRVGGENLVFAMPEVGIGLFPDVGASYVLSRMAGEFGLYLGLTGHRLTRGGAAAAGIITHPVASASIPDALDRAAHAEDLDAALAELAVATEPLDRGELAAIEEAFSAGSVSEILTRLKAADDPFSAKAAAAIEGKSPTSLAVTFREIRGALDRPFEACLRDEFRILCQILKGHDFYEGIRAVVIDKDNAPKWNPASLSAVDEAAIKAHFQEPEGGDLTLPPGGETSLSVHHRLSDTLP